MELKKNEYQCAMCGGVYEKGWSDEEAEKECVKNFGEEMAHDDDRAVVCDDCYQKIRPDKHPEELAKAKEEFFNGIKTILQRSHAWRSGGIIPTKAD